MCGTLSWPASRKRKLATNLCKSSTKRLNGLTHTHIQLYIPTTIRTESHELSINLLAANHRNLVRLRLVFCLPVTSQSQCQPDSATKKCWPKKGETKTMSWPKCPRKPRKKQLNLNYLVQLARQMKIFENRENTLTKVCEETLLKHTSALNKHAAHRERGEADSKWKWKLRLHKKEVEP